MLALVCGTGGLPSAVARAQAVKPMVCVLEGFAPDGLDADITFRLERLGSFLAGLSARGVTEVCLCGAITRPDVDPAMIDAATLPLIPALMQAMGQGDDGALRGVITIFENHGLVVRAAHDLAPELLPQSGVLTIAQPGPEARADVQEALLALAEMGARDVGQSCVIRNGQRIALEEQDGTDAMLARLSGRYTPPHQSGDPLSWAVDTVAEMLDDTADWLSGRAASDKSVGGILYKGPKPDQDRRADLPTIGPATAKAAAEAGLDGIILDAGGVIVLERDEVLRFLNGMRMFLWVRPR